MAGATPQSLLDTWLRSSWFWYLHASLSTVIAVTIRPLAAVLVTATCAVVSLLIARHGGTVADKLRGPDVPTL